MGGIGAYPEDMRATMADIARETGLTLGTVSRALNTEGKYAIASETRERVLAIASRLGYRPNIIGRALAAGSASLILLISPDPFAPYYIEISRHLSAQAALHGYTFLSGGTRMVTGTAGVPANDWLYGVDGMVVCDYLPHQEAYILEALRLKIPIVGLGFRHPFPTDFVKIDLHAAVRDLLDHMLDSGCQNLAMLSSPGTNPEEDPRLSTYFETVKAVGMEPNVLITRDQSRASGRQAIHDSFAAHGPIDGLFCENDILAMGAYRGLTDLGIRVPGDVLLAGCDGVEDALYQFTPITTLVQPFERMCVLAWSLLQKRIEGHDEPPQIREVSAVLQKRASTERSKN
ncbi:LacI family DNA-binding transcriptional regulator [soil metagenome]